MMNFLSTKSRMAIGQVSLLVSVLLTASLLGLMPDRLGAIRDGRAALAEVIATNSSIFITQKDVDRLEGILSLVVDRNEDLLSAGLRTETGQWLVTIGDHEEHWRNDDSEISDNTQVSVSIWEGDTKWGRGRTSIQPFDWRRLDGNCHGSANSIYSVRGITEFPRFLFLFGKNVEAARPLSGRAGSSAIGIGYHGRRPLSIGQ